jgi:hypothetical protein
VEEVEGWMSGWKGENGVVADEIDTFDAEQKIRGS